MMNEKFLFFLVKGLSKIIIAGIFIQCFSQIASAQERSKFRGLYIGMTISELDDELAQLGRMAILRFALDGDGKIIDYGQDSYYPNNYYFSGVAVQGVSKEYFLSSNKTELAQHLRNPGFAMIAGVSLKSDYKSINETILKSELDKVNDKSVFGILKSLNEIEIESVRGYNGEYSCQEWGYQCFWIPQTEKFREAVLRDLTLYPNFFDSSGLQMEQMAQEIANNFAFVGNNFFGGANKGFDCNCYVGLLTTGEGLKLISDSESDPLAWHLEVFEASVEYSDKFSKTKPKF
jgi:hypothetical protein